MINLNKKYTSRYSGILGEDFPIESVWEVIRTTIGSMEDTGRILTLSDTGDSNIYFYTSEFGEDADEETHCDTYVFTADEYKGPCGNDTVLFDEGGPGSGGGILEIRRL